MDTTQESESCKKIEARLAKEDLYVETTGDRLDYAVSAFIDFAGNGYIGITEGGDSDRNPMAGWLFDHDLAWILNDNVPNNDSLPVDIDDVIEPIRDLIMKEFNDALAIRKEIETTDRINELKERYKAAHGFVVVSPRGFANELVTLAFKKGDDYLSVVNRLKNGNSGYHNFHDNDDDFWDTIRKHRMSGTDEWVQDVDGWAERWEKTQY